MNYKVVEEIKIYLGITTDDLEVTKNIELKARAVAGYLNKGGAKLTNDEAYTDEVISCIAVGVNDLLNCKAGDTKFSPAFNMLAMQVCRG